MEVYGMKKMRLFFAIFMVIGCATGLQAMQVDSNGTNGEVKKSDAKKPFETSCTKIKQENLDLIDGLLCCSLEDVQSALEAGADPDVEFLDNNLHTNSPVCWAVLCERIDILQELIKHNADVVHAVIRRFKQNALHSAAYNNWVDLISGLIEKFNFPIDLGDIDGFTPLHLAIDRQHVEAAKALLGYRANPSLPNNEGWFPIHTAAKRGLDTIVKLLVQDYKVPVDQRPTAKRGQDLSRCTPLYIASKRGHSTTVQLLLELGADKKFLFANVEKAKTTDGKKE